MAQPHIIHRLTLCPSPTVLMTESAWLLVFRGRKVLVREEETIRFPLASELEGWDALPAVRQYLGAFGGRACYGVQVSAEEPPSDAMSFRDLRSLPVSGCEEELCTLAVTALHLLNWSAGTRFCGRCGGAMRDKSDERARVCPDCGNVVYPRISPAIIVAVHRGDELLLAHNNSFRDGTYSVIAGFVEPGETLEDCARREIREETGIRVRNLRYFGSQPWPYPDSLMLAFTAEYDGGEVRADGVEIGRAGWFRVGNLPPIPAAHTIAGRMIRSFIEQLR